MIVIGHPWIKSSHFRKVFSKEDIQKSTADEVVLLEPLVDSHALAAYCQEHQIPYAVTACTINDAILANALGASYLVCEEDDAMVIEPIAQEYLFDASVLVLIHEEKEIAKIARSGIDGVIFPEAIV
jgi:hypothetical protein